MLFSRFSGHVWRLMAGIVFCLVAGNIYGMGTGNRCRGEPGVVSHASALEDAVLYKRCKLVVL